AVGNTTEKSHVTVSQDSSVTSTKGSIDADATGEATNFSWAEPTVLQDGTVALGVGVAVDNADIKTQIDGTLDAAGGPPKSLYADPAAGPVDVNYTTDTIHIPDHGYTDGTAVTYSNGGAPSIGGLTDGQKYYVQFVDQNTLRLANGPTLALTYNRPAQYDTNDVHPTHTLGTLAKLDFEPSAVNKDTDTITFPNPHGLPNGQAVTYLGTASSLDGSGVEQDSGVGGLDLGQTYYVKKISDTAIKLTDKDGNVIDLTDAGQGTHSLLYQNHVASFQPESAVNNDSHTITFTSPHGFQTGDQ